MYIMRKMVLTGTLEMKLIFRAKKRAVTLVLRTNNLDTKVWY